MILAPLWECGFEGGDFCGAVQEVGRDDFNWTIGDSSGTPTDQTGPDYAMEGENFIYLHSSGQETGDRAVYVSNSVS